MPWSSPTPAKRKGDFVSPNQQYTIPKLVFPPIGMNQVDSLAQMPPSDAVFMYNMVSYRYGTKVRQGYKQWATTVGSGGVKTLVPYTGSVLANNRLFAMATDGIYDVSLSVATPSVKLSFGGPTSRSGQGVWCAITTLAGFFTTYCDEEYGYFLYTESTDTWAAVTTVQVTGINPNLFCYSMVYAERLWFIQRGTSSAWYLPVDSIFGAATQFNFGNKFKHGGTLQALYTWTFSGATGPSEYLVAISSSGEILIYQGTDPSVAGSFAVVGAWFVGDVPVGRRIAGNFGGDLFILSVSGLLPLSKVVQGNLTQIQQIEISRKISPAIRALLNTTFTLNGWEVKLYPSQDSLIVTSPLQTGIPATQFVQSLNNQGWSIFQSMPIYTAEVWGGNLYFGALDRNVYIISGDTDAQPRTGTGLGNNIISSVLGSFQDYDEPGQYHIGQFIRPVFLSNALPSYSISVAYDYDIISSFAPASGAMFAAALFDVADWDNGVWGGQFISVEAVNGVTGIGRSMAIGLSMSTSSETTLIRYDLMYDSGGVL